MLLVDHAISHSDAYDVLGLCWSHWHIALFTYRNTAITLSIETGIPEKTVYTLIRRRRTRCPIRVYTVCHSSSNQCRPRSHLKVSLVLPFWCTCFPYYPPSFISYGKHGKQANKPVQSPILIINQYFFMITINHIYCIWTVLVQILVIILKNKK